jgi:hypothetical protein
MTFSAAQPNIDSAAALNIVIRWAASIVMMASVAGRNDSCQTCLRVALRGLGSGPFRDFTGEVELAFARKSFGRTHPGSDPVIRSPTIPNARPPTTY